ncbi:outer membrane lipoprotein-sorting protein [Sediminispirochaeta bajacaliforniensis]|uniref:outer membrane lipoprotein-sorting protein n=1 Tax=Sediminispirochaeta bajacaliforniensis TaxID=148 RepID=UPI00035E7278|nr:outer membrane lipoprotein-sorting protein [Sediminispirochaeta bajacaliforniensis]
MKRIGLASLLALCGVSTIFAQTPRAEELLHKTESIINPSIYRSEMSIRTVKPGERESIMAMEVFYKEDAGSFIEMTEPPRSRGLRFLEKETNLYMYNPKSNSRRPLRLSPEQSFQGTIFSNNDISDPKYTDDYSAHFSDGETIEHPDFGDVTCLVIIAEAKSRKAPYGSIKIWINAENLRPLRFDYYAKSGLLFKSMILSDYKDLAGDLRPALMHMDSYEIEGAYSEVVIHSMEALSDIPDSRFSTAALVR